MLDKYIDDNKDNIINSICDLIRFPSVSIEDLENTDAPFGKACSEALEFALELGKSMGFRTKNIDNYCGYIEFGEGEELVGIIGQLDVVPAVVSDGWSTPPFEPSIRDGKLFGRGSIDDKGPVIAALYAMKAVYENMKVNKRVRLILGLNEEKNWKCIEHYKKTEEFPSISLSPDANFPGIYAEKGIISVELKHPFFIKNAEILNIDCNQNAINVVPKFCAITLKIKNDELLYKILNLDGTDSSLDIEVQNLGNNIIKIYSHGIAAHAAHPELGKNAITNLVKFLLNNFETTNFSDISDAKKLSEYIYLRKLYELGLFTYTSPVLFSINDFSLDNSEKSISIIQDESGILTSNIAILDYVDNKLIIRINLRVPVNTSLEFIENKYNDLKTIFDCIEINILNKQNSLYIRKDSYLVKTLVDIFNQKTGGFSEPIAIGGGTYARAFKNSISYGITFPGDLDMCHQVNEFIEIEKLILGAKIYAEAIYQLAK